MIPFSRPTCSFPPNLKDLSLYPISLTSHCPVFSYSPLLWNSQDDLSLISFLSFSFKPCQYKSALVRPSCCSRQWSISVCVLLYFSAAADALTHFLFLEEKICLDFKDLKHQTLSVFLYLSCPSISGYFVHPFSSPNLSVLGHCRTELGLFLFLPLFSPLKVWSIVTENNSWIYDSRLDLSP